MSEEIRVALWFIGAVVLLVAICLWATRYFFWKEYDRRDQEIAKLKGRVDEALVQGTRLANPAPRQRPLDENDSLLG